MSTRARLARLERRQRAGGEAIDLEHLRLAAGIVLARHRGDDDAVADLRARLARLPPPSPGGALEAAAHAVHSAGDPGEWTSSPE